MGAAPVPESEQSSDSSGNAPAVVKLDPEVAPKLAPEFVKYFNEVLSKRPPTHTVALEEVRQDPHKWAQPWIPNLDKISNRTVDFQVPTTDESNITIRAYYPDPGVFGLGPYAVHVNYHGGGYIFGDLMSDAAFCSTMRTRLPIVVVDVDYRLCPDVAYGQNIKDAWSALLWVHNHPNELNIKQSSISIGGISAGGLFSCVLPHLARDYGIQLRLSIPAVPPTADHSAYAQASDSVWPSFTEYQNAPMLTWGRISHFQKYTFPKDKLSEIYASVPRFWISPLEADNFYNLCDTFLITAECDPIRDEGEGYAKLLVEAGNKVTLKRYLGVPHPFMHMTAALPHARQYDDDVSEALKVAHKLYEL